MQNSSRKFGEIPNWGPVWCEPRPSSYGGPLSGPWNTAQGGSDPPWAPS
ncbi:hypothetical protein EV651_11399 [Kribbella sp. VKM Ac-2571]|nr:hypothetical protein EV651_11399 [Kribbella sp. VKM Ac-2571]